MGKLSLSILNVVSFKIVLTNKAINCCSYLHIYNERNCNGCCLLLTYITILTLLAWRSTSIIASLAECLQYRLLNTKRSTAAQTSSGDGVAKTMTCTIGETCRLNGCLEATRLEWLPSFVRFGVADVIVA